MQCSQTAQQKKYANIYNYNVKTKATVSKNHSN